MPKIGDVIGFVGWFKGQGRIISTCGDFCAVKAESGCYYNIYLSQNCWWYIEKREKVRWLEEGF